LKANGKLAVDTNAVIAYRQGTPDVCSLIEGADIIILPVIVFGELLFGAANSTRPQENEQATRKFLAQSVLVLIDESIVTCYAHMRLELKKKGRPLPENDIWIAAICLELGVPLLSRDSHFDHVPNLRVVNWTK